MDFTDSLYKPEPVQSVLIGQVSVCSQVAHRMLVWIVQLPRHWPHGGHKKATRATSAEVQRKQSAHPNRLKLLNWQASNSNVLRSTFGTIVEELTIEDNQCYLIGPFSLRFASGFVWGGTTFFEKNKKLIMYVPIKNNERTPNFLKKFSLLPGNWSRYAHDCG